MAPLVATAGRGTARHDAVMDTVDWVDGVDWLDGVDAPERSVDAELLP